MVCQLSLVVILIGSEVSMRYSFGEVCGVVSGRKTSPHPQWATVVQIQSSVGEAELPLSAFSPVAVSALRSPFSSELKTRVSPG